MGEDEVILQTLTQTEALIQNKRSGVAYFSFSAQIFP